MKRVVMFSGGVGSWAAARRVADRHGADDLTLLFTDTLIEDADLYRFLVEAAANIYRCAGRLDGIVQLAAATPAVESSSDEERAAHIGRVRALVAQVMPRLAWIVEGRTPWQVFADVRYLGNSRVDPCSRTLKRDVADKWLADHCDPKETTVYVGIDWTEEHRFVGVPDANPPRLGLRERRRRDGWTYEAPMCEAPFITKAMMLDELRRLSIAPPRLYAMGFSHNNCGGFCVKAGLGHFTTLLRAMPDRYRYHERKEQEIRDLIGRQDVTVARDWATRPPENITMRELRERVESGQEPDLFDVGGCGCFIDTPEDGGGE